MTAKTFQELYKKPSQAKIAINKAINQFIYDECGGHYERIQNIIYQGNTFAFSVSFTRYSIFGSEYKYKITKNYIYIYTNGEKWYRRAKWWINSHNIICQDLYQYIKI